MKTFQVVIVGLILDILITVVEVIQLTSILIKDMEVLHQVIIKEDHLMQDFNRVIEGQLVVHHEVVIKVILIQKIPAILLATTLLVVQMYKVVILVEIMVVMGLLAMVVINHKLVPIVMHLEALRALPIHLALQA